MGDSFMKLPEGFREKFMQQVVSRTSPEDAIRLSCVSKMFQSVADSDFVWDSFIVPDQIDAASNRAQLQCEDFDSSKDLFLCLAAISVPVAEGRDDEGYHWLCSYFLDKWTGKRRLEMSSSYLSFTFLHTDYWMKRHRLGHVVWLEIKGKLTLALISQGTSIMDFTYPSVGITEEESINKFVYLDPRIAKSQRQYLKYREDTLFEVELGDYFHNDGDNRDPEITVREVKSGKPKCGIKIYGMELPPKRESINLNCKSSHQAHSYSERNIKGREGEMSKEGEGCCEDTDLFRKLPEGFRQAFMEEVVSRTSPVDACRLSVVAKSFRSAAESDAVWERLLPNDCQQFLCQGDSLPNISFASKKDLYLFLVGNPLLVDANTKIFFWLDEWSGKKCFMIPFSVKLYREGDWDHSYESSFNEIYGTYCEEWIGIHGRISTSMLSPDTTYTAYLVHKWDNGFGYNFSSENRPPFEVSVGCSDYEIFTGVVYLDRKIGETRSEYVVERKDGWLEVELGEYFNKGGEYKDLEMSVMDVTTGLSKTSFQTRGIEIRPNHD